MKNIVLEKIVRLFLYVMLILSGFLLLRGHNSPGGGFIAGIIASAGFILYGIVFGPDRLLKKLRMNPRYIIGIGLLIAFLSALLPVFAGKPPLTGLWMELVFVPGFALTLGTPLFFDIGVFIVVTGIILAILTSIMNLLKWNF